MLNIITAIKARLLNYVDEGEVLVKKKRQFNIKIEKEIIDQVRYLASRYGAPLAPTAAHMLQVGAYSLSKVSEDPRKKEILSSHIIDTHLLGIGADDDPAIIMMGEAGDTWKLLRYSKDVLRKYRKYCEAPRITKKTGDISYMQKAERDLLKSVVGFTMLLQKWSLGSRGDLSNDQDREE